MGPINSPHNIYLLLRGLKTFELRMQRHNENGQAVAEFLAAHPRVEKVYYPGLPSHPYYDVARRTMRGFGGLVTFLVSDADWRATAGVVDAVRLPRIGPSLGGVESLIEQPLVMSYHNCTAEDRAALRHPRQHDPAGLRHREHRGPGRRLAAGIGPMKFRTRAIHVGNEHDPQTGAVVPPIHLASTFVQPGAGQWGEFDYTRSGNPTRKGVEANAGRAGGRLRSPGLRVRAWPPPTA